MVRDAYPVDAHRLARRGNIHEGTHVRARRDPPRHDFLSFRDHVFNRKVYVGKGGTVHRDELLETCSSGQQAWREKIERGIGDKQFVDDWQVARVPDVMVEAAYIGRVWFGGHG